MLLAGGSWPAATAVVFLAVVAGIVLPRLEVDHHWRIGVSYDASAAQAALAAVAGGMITLTGFVLAAMTLMVQTIQGQSPRLLRAFAHADTTPLLFGVFTATFVFALVVLSRVRTGQVPTISVGIALVLVLVSTGLFLRLLAVFRSSLSAGGLARVVGREARQLIDELYRQQFRPAVVPDAGDTVSAQVTWTQRHQGMPGVFQGLDGPGLVRAAVASQGLITVLPAIGDFVATGAMLATGTGRAPAPDELVGMLTITPARSLRHDLGYGFRLLADISIRALSPAVNDPTTAVQALDQVDDLLRRIAMRSLGDGRLTDAAGNSLVRYPAPTWQALLALALDETIQYGASSVQVARRLRALLEDLLGVVPDERRPPVEIRLSALDGSVAAAFPREGQSEALSADRQGLGSPERADPPRGA